MLHVRQALFLLLYHAKSSVPTDADVITAFSKIELNCKNEDVAMNVKSVMSFGLELVGFGAKRQNIQDLLNLQCFRSHFGIGSESIVAIIADMKHNKRENIILSHFMMTLCWLKLYKTEHVMSGRWGFGEEFCRDTVKQIPSRLQCLKAKKIKFGPFDSKRIYFGTVDCVHCETNEFQTDPNSEWYFTRGVSYEVVVDICRDEIIWTAGPKPASTHDITFFCSGNQVSANQHKNEATWDKNALYFQIPEG
jgi:hypothetical protein